MNLPPNTLHNVHANDGPTTFFSFSSFNVFSGAYFLYQVQKMKFNFVLTL
jgi:hypothetical protein